MGLGTGCEGTTDVGAPSKGELEPNSCVTDASKWSGDKRYKFDEVSWRGTEDPILLPFRTETDSFVSYMKLTDTEVHDGFTRAADSWNNVTTADVQVRHTSTDEYSSGTSSAWDQDSLNNVWVVNRARDTDTSVSGNTDIQQVGAVAKLWYDTENLGCPTDCDIAFYAKEKTDDGTETRTWSAETDGTVPSGTLDYPSVLRHELGHCLGILDNTIKGSIMYKSISTGKRRTSTAWTRMRSVGCIDRRRRRGWSDIRAVAAPSPDRR
jgi:hypothetical protein